MNSYAILIESSAFLKSLRAEEIDEYLKSGSFKTHVYKKNSIIHFDGEICDKLEVILSGKVVIERIDHSGNLLTIGHFNSDDILGGNLLFSKNPYFPMTITAAIPCVILEVKKEVLFDLLCNNKQFLQTYLEYISEHTLFLGTKIKNYMSKTIRERIINYLIYECNRQNSTTVKLDVSKKFLAEKIGVQRTSLSRELRKMKDEGLILFDTNSISVLKTDVLN
ncbi:hypothetical protein BKP37_01165 [Anaerobacillus alkalilacustris]|uniref:Crp/Fnr family transcriptional regulator n=1 Tax=Anaerobacillus alkalilacustris TaxID=393763 RepID=A0A1S2LXZ6_9BACI|nr:Crp/Fnr family transcriptional regulator [Anaerobacillus alkalilacustris]OIJ17174.1 hypothetical protein BKP37_01165 [Anaerobacillus alkalilacustris]